MSVASPVIDFIDPVNRRIHLRSGVTAWHPVDDIYTEVRNLRRTDESLRPYDMFCEALPLVSKGGGKFTGRGLKLLGGTRVIPFDEVATQTVTGELLSDEGLEGSELIDTSGLSSTIKINYQPPPSAEYILTFSEQINAQSFVNNAVTLDVGDGQPGTTFPRGTPTDPVDNLADALTIAHSRALHRIDLAGFVVATVAEDLTGIALVGGSGAENGVILSGASTVRASFERLIVTGAQSGLARFRDCILGTTGLGGLTGAEGRIVDCIINNSAGIVQNATGAGCLFDNCSFVAPDDPQITIDANGKGFGLRKCTGNILLENQTADETLEVHIEGARFEVAATCTDGTLVIAGSGMVTDNSGGTIIDETGLVKPDRISEAWQRLGLDPSHPLTTTLSQITVDGITIDLTGDGTTTSTATRQ